MKSGNPHPASYVAFATRAYEDSEWAALDPLFLSRTGAFDPRGVASIGAYYEATAKDTQETLRLGIEAQLREGGLAGHLENPALRQLVEENATFHARVVGLSQIWQLKRAAIERLEQVPWRPRRETVVDVIVGAWAATGAGTNADALRLLNRHAPPFASELVEHGNVRDALKRFASRSVFLLAPQHRIRPYACAYARILIHRTRTALSLWDELHATKGANRIENYISELRRSGHLLDMYQRAFSGEYVADGEVESIADALLVKECEYRLAATAQALSSAGVSEADLPARNAIADGPTSSPDHHSVGTR